MTFLRPIPNEPTLKDHAITLLDIEIALQRRGERFLAHMVGMARLAVEADAGMVPAPRTKRRTERRSAEGSVAG